MRHAIRLSADGYATGPLWSDEESTGTRLGGQRTWTEKVEQTHALRALQLGREMVYAIRTPDGLIKIGCSRDLAKRRYHLSHEILGFIFGDFDDEQAIHAGLRESVARGREYYHPTPEVLAVVNGMRDTFGLPHLAA